MAIKYSIIVPVYNMDKYLKECLESVLCIERNDFELIVVNDGSTDNSKKIILDYAKKDKRLVFLDKKHAGQSKAINYGIEQSSGEWLLFLDSDDYFICSPFEKLDKTISEIKDAEYIYIDDKSDDCIEYILDKENKQNLMLATLKINQKQNVFSGYNYLTTPFMKAIKKSLLISNNILFDENLVMGNDMMFNIIVQSKIKKLVVIKEKYYYYRTNLNSVSKGYNSEIPKLDYYFQEKLADFVRLNTYELLKDYALDICVLNGILVSCNAYFLRISKIKFSVLKKEYIEFLSKPLYANALKNKKALSCFKGIKKVYLINAKQNIFFLSFIIKNFSLILKQLKAKFNH